MDIEGLKNQVQHFANGSFDSAARVESICAALDQLQREKDRLQRQLIAARVAAGKLIDRALDAGLEEGVAGANAEIVRLQRELEEARKDAERLEWLADNSVIEFGHVRHDGIDPASTRQPLYNAIDAAREKQG